MSDTDMANATLRLLRDGADGEEIHTGDYISHGIALMMNEIPGYLDRRVAEAVARHLEGAK